MNVENILAVANAIEQRSIPWLGFNMANFVFDKETAERYGVKDHFTHKCGTVACIGGWTNALRLDLREKTATDDPGAFSSETGAAAWLGISTYTEDLDGNSQADNLFYARNHPLYKEQGSRMWADITAEQAVRTLRHLAATNEVDWTV